MATPVVLGGSDSSSLGLTTHCQCYLGVCVCVVCHVGPSSHCLVIVTPHNSLTHLTPPPLLRI